MSIDLITMVRRRLDVSHGELLVAIELADAANDDGDGIMVGVDRIADRSRQDPRTVQRQLARLRSLGWLLTVVEGGMRGGRGHVTRYRINAAWIKGDILSGFPDFVPKHYHKEKGGTLSPIHGAQPVDGSEERVTKPPLKGDKNDVKGDRAVSPDPLTLNPPDAPARESPSVSRGAGGKNSDGYDAAKRVGFWRAQAYGWLISECSALQITKYGTNRFEDLPTGVRLVMPDKIKLLIDKAIEWERPPAVKGFSAILRHIEEEITLELRQFKPATPAELSSANAELNAA